ncbi:MAG: sugar ABC transporter permease [Rhodobacteraceae bacterium]|nr:sugar ABC transporter permease [Paracoccaceae bacterium]
MSFAGWLIYCLLALWAGLGSAWLLTTRRYHWRQAPRFAIDLLGFPVEFAQSLWGRGGVPYVLLLPNMLIFGMFTFLPMILNFYVSFTGGESINLLQRPLVGSANYGRILDCESVLRPESCSNAGLSFWTALFNTLGFVALAVPALCITALITALVVNKSLAGRGFWRAMFFYPVMLSPVVIANIWTWVLHRKGALNEVIGAANQQIASLAGRSGFDLVLSVLFAIVMLICSQRLMAAAQRGALLWGALFGTCFVLLAIWANPGALVIENGRLASLGLGFGGAALLLYWAAQGHPRTHGLVMALGVMSAALLLMVQFGSVFDLAPYRPINWLVVRNTGWPFFWLVFVFTWSHMGFYMLILLAGLQAIPADLYEAAEMDATRPARAFFRITLPLLMPTFTVVVVLALIRSFQIFDEVYLLTGGGPGRETFMLVQNIYEQAFTGDHPDYGEAAAGSVLMALVIGLFTFVQLFLTRRQSDF